MGFFYLHANHLPPLPLTYTVSVNNIYYRYHHTPDLYNAIETLKKRKRTKTIDKIVTKTKYNGEQNKVNRSQNNKDRIFS